MGRKKGQPQNDWCVYRQKDMGELHEKNEARFPLPPVGSYVVVRVRETFLRGYGEDKSVLGIYNFDDNCLDAWGKPLVYRVMEYKLGIDKPTAPGNAVYLEARTKRGHYTYKKWIDTLRISIGYYQLEVRPDDEQIYEHVEFYNHGVENCPVAEYTSSKRNKIAENKEDIPK